MGWLNFGSSVDALLGRLDALEERMEQAESDAQADKASCEQQGLDYVAPTSDPGSRED